MSDTVDKINPAEPLHAAVALLREEPPLRPGLSERTARRRHHERVTRRWLAGSAGALATVLATALLTHDSAPPLGTVTFAVQTGSEEGVSLVGDFNSWETNTVRLTPEGNHQWKVTLHLPPGRYRFAYVTDQGEWLADASAAPVMDDFGRPTSILTVTAN